MSGIGLVLFGGNILTNQLSEVSYLRAWSVCIIHTEEDFKVLHCGIQHRDLRLREAIVWDLKALKLIFHLLYNSMVGDCPDVELFLF